PAGSFLAWAGVVDTFILAWDNFPGLDPWIDKFEALRRRHPVFPSPQVEARVACGIFCALMYRQAHHPGLVSWAERVYAVVLGSPDIRLRMQIGHQLLFYYTWWTGDHAKVVLLLNALRPGVDASGSSPLALIG